MVNYPRNKRIRLFYVGSGDIGIPVLDSVVSCPEIEFIGCATQPDRPKGRKRVLTPTPIGRRCENLGFKPEKPDSVNCRDFLDIIASLDSDFVLVFSFGQILRKPLLDLPTYGCLNIHTSLLPKFRGASPISAAIVAGDTHTGISFMKMDEGLDTGPIYRQFEMKIPSEVNTYDLEKKIASLAAEKVCEVILDVVRNRLIPRDQGATKVSYAKKLTKNDGRISWINDATFIERQVRGYYPWPGAWFLLKTETVSRKIIITSASIEINNKNPEQPGTVIDASNGNWKIACAKNVLKIKKLKPEGKKEMDVADYLRGNPLPIGSTI